MQRRRHAPEFKRKVCAEIRSGALGRREAQRLYGLSDNLIHAWLAHYDADGLGAPQPGDDAALHAACEARIADLERKVGQLTMALEQRSRGRGPH